MKEYTFLEAVEILNEGKCEKIMPYDWMKEERGYILKDSYIVGAGLRVEHLFGKWKCIGGMKPRTVEELEKDIITLVLRLKGESPDTFAPETAEVMVRWLPKANEVLRNACLPED